MKTATKPKPISLRPHEVRELLTNGRTEIRRRVNNPKDSPVSVHNAEWVEPYANAMGHTGCWSFKRTTNSNRPERERRWACNSIAIDVLRCLFGVEGTRLWAREIWRCTGGGDWHGICYEADEDGPYETKVAYKGLGLDQLGRKTVYDHSDEWERLVCDTRYCTDWRPSGTMPRWASRFDLSVAGVLTERKGDRWEWAAELKIETE